MHPYIGLHTSLVPHPAVHCRKETSNVVVPRVVACSLCCSEASRNAYFISKGGAAVTPLPPLAMHPLVLLELLRWLLLRWDQLRILELGIVAQLKTCRYSDVRK